MRTIWPRLLERLATGDPVVGIDEMRRWGRLEFERAIGVGILRETEPARWIMCDFCPDRHWSEVITVAGGRRMFISCPEEGSVNVEPSRLRQWRIDAGRVTELAAGALGLSAAIEVLLLQHLWSLGRRRLGGRYRDIFLGVGGGPPLAEMAAAIRSSIGQGSALLLTVGCDGNPDGLPTGHQAVDFASVSRIDGERVLADVEYLEDRFSEGVSSTRKSAPSIPAPAGTTWGDVSIIVFDGILRVTIRGKVHEIDFAELGVDHRSQPIELLKLFAAARGTLDTTKIQNLVSGEAAVKMRVRRLRQLLQDLIGVDGDPIENHRKAKAYVCQFEIRLAGDDGFRTPAGVTWLDLAFHERVDGRILVTVPERQQFRARGAQNRSGESVGEVAEEHGTVTRTYSLEEMGLRTEAGQLTSEGAAFTELLRAGGMLPRGGNDVVVLELAAQLREWTGLDGEPFRLLDASRSWTAVFACSSEIKVAKGPGAVSGSRPRPGRVE
jgi:hypothetical protein